MLPSIVRKSSILFQVKPVKDVIIRAIRCWRTLAGADFPGPSEAAISLETRIMIIKIYAKT